MTEQHMDLDFVADWNDQVAVVPQPTMDYRRRALWLWPGLERRQLRHAHDDPLWIARLVARGTRQPIETVLAMLLDLA